MATMGGGEAGERLLAHIRQRVARVWPFGTVVLVAATVVSSMPLRIYVGLLAIAATFKAVQATIRLRQLARTAKLSLSARIAAEENVSHETTEFMAMLAEIAAVSSEKERKPAVGRLISAILIASLRNAVTRVPADSTRSVFYSLNAEATCLNRFDSEGWAREDLPPRRYDRAASQAEARVVDTACGDVAAVIDDASDDHLWYRSRVRVPVRAGERSFGLLSVECTIANGYTDPDVRFLIFLARILALGLILLGDCVEELLRYDEGNGDPDGATVPAPTSR